MRTVAVIDTGIPKTRFESRHCKLHRSSRNDEGTLLASGRYSGRGGFWRKYAGRSASHDRRESGEFDPLVHRRSHRRHDEPATSTSRAAMMSVVIDGVLNFYTIFSRMTGFTIHATVCNDLYSMIVDPHADSAMRHGSHHEKRASSKNRNHVADRLHGVSNRASCRWRVKRLIGTVLGKISTAPRTGRALPAVAGGTPALPCQVSPIGSGHECPCPSGSSRQHRTCEPSFG